MEATSLTRKGKKCFRVSGIRTKKLKDNVVELIIKIAKIRRILTFNPAFIVEKRLSL